MEILLILLGVFGLGAFYQYLRVKKAEKERQEDFDRGWRLQDERIRQQDRDAEIQRALARKEALTGPQHPLDVTNELPTVFVMHSIIYNHLLKMNQVDTNFGGCVNYERTFCGVPIIIDDNQPRQTTWEKIIEVSKSYSKTATSKNKPFRQQSVNKGLQVHYSGQGQEDDILSKVFLTTVLVNSMTDHATSTDIPATQNDNFSEGGGEFGGGGSSGSWDSNSGGSYDSGSSSFDSGSDGGCDSGGGCD